MAATMTSPAPGASALVSPHDPIDLRSGVILDVAAAFGPDWFALTVGDGIDRTTLNVTVYLRRRELRALRDRLHAIDSAFPEPQS